MKKVFKKSIYLISTLAVLVFNVSPAVYALETFSDGVLIKGELEVQQDATLDDVDVQDMAAAGDVTINGNDLNFAGTATTTIDFNRQGAKIWVDDFFRMQSDNHLYLNIPGYTYVQGDLKVLGNDLVFGGGMWYDGTQPKIEFNQGGSVIYDDRDLRIKSDDNIYLDPTAATGDVHVITGNFRVGNGVPGTAAMDGEDAYIEGELEVDGAVTFDGAITVNSGLTLAGNVDMGNNLILNIGAAGTDFVAGGGLTLASGLTVTAGGATITAGGLDMTNDAITNIGAAGTDFSGTGGLTLADDLTVTGNDITFGNGEIITNGIDGTIAFTDGANTLASIVDNGTTGYVSTNALVIGTNIDPDIQFTGTGVDFEIAQGGTYSFEDAADNVLMTLADAGTTGNMTVTGDLTINGTLSAALSDAGTLDSLDSTQFLRSDTSDAFTSGTLTLDAGTTLDANNTVDIQGATVTGHLTPTTGNLYDIGVTGARMRTGYFQTSVVVGAASTTITDGNLTTATGAFTLNPATYTRVGDAGTPDTASTDDDLFASAAFEVDGASDLDGTLNVAGVVTTQADVDMDATGGSAGDPDLSVDGYALFAGTVDFNSVVDVQGATVTGDLLPTTAGAWDLGSATVEWELLFLGDSNTALSFGAAQNVTVGWDTTYDALEILGDAVSIGAYTLGTGAQTATEAGDLFVGSDFEVEGTADLDGTLNVAGQASLAQTLNVSGAVTIDNNLEVKGSTTLGDSVAADTTVFNSRIHSNVVPDEDGMHNLGSATFEWQDLYIDGTAYVDTLAVDFIDLTPTSNADAFDYDGSNVTSAAFIDAALYNTSGTIMDFDYDAVAVLAGTLFGLDMDLETNVTDGANAVTGVHLTIPDSGAGTSLGIDIDGSPDFDIELQNAERIFNSTNGDIAFSDGTDTLTMDFGGDVAGAVTLSVNDDNLYVMDNLLPQAADTYNLGGVDNEWKALYVGSDATIYVGNGQEVALSYDETTDDAFEITGKLVSIGDDPGGGTAVGANDLIVVGDLEVDTIVDFDGSLDFDGTTFDVVGSAISLDGTAASNFNVTGASVDLTLGSAAGSVNVSAGEAVADAVNIDSTGGFDLDAALQVNIDSAQAAATAIVLNTSDAAGGVDINVGTGGLTIDQVGVGTGISIDAANASNFTVSGATLDLTLSSTAGGVVIDGGEAASLDAVRITASNATGGIDIDAGSNGITVDTTGALSLDTTATAANLTMTANNAGAATLVIEATNATGVGNLDINVNDAFTVDSVSAGLSLDGVTASNFTVTGASADLTLSSVGGSVNVQGTEADAAAVYLNASNAAGGIDIDFGTGGFDVDGTGAISLDADLASNFNTSAGDLTLTAEAASVTLVGVEADAAAIFLDANNDAAGGIDMDFGTGGVDIDGTGAISLDADLASNFNTSVGDITVEAETGSVTIKGDESAADAIFLDANEAVGVGITMVTGATAGYALTGGPFDVDVTGMVSLDADLASNFNTSAGDLTLTAEAASVTLVGVEADAAAIFLDANNNVAGGIDMDFGTGGFDVDGTGAISLDADLASNFNTSVGDITVEAETGSVTIKGDEAAADAISLDANDAVGTGITMVTGATAGYALTGGPFDVDVTGMVSLDADLASNFNTSAGDLTLTAEAASVTLVGVEADAAAIFLDANNNAAGGIDMDFGTGGFDVLGTGALSLDTTATAANLTITANDVGQATLTLAVTNAGAGTAVIDIDAQEAIELDSSAAGISLDGVLASNFTVTGAGADLTLSSVGGSTIVSASEAVATALQLTASAGGIDMTAGGGTYEIDILTAQDLNVGVNGTGMDVNFYTDTAGESLVWDDADGNLVLTSTDADATAATTMFEIDVTTDETVGETRGLAVEAVGGAESLDVGIDIKNEDADDAMTIGQRIWAAATTTIATGIQFLVGANQTDDTTGGITTAIDATEADITTALSVGAAGITGTTGVINYDNFDVDAAGNITVAAAQGLDTNGAGALELGMANATSIVTGNNVTTFSLAGTGLTTVNVATGNSAAATLNLATSNQANVINVGTGSAIDDINIGTGTGADTIDIGVAAGGKTILIGTNNTDADTITIGSALDATTITSANWSVTAAGAAAFDSTLDVNGIATLDAVDIDLAAGEAVAIDVTANTVETLDITGTADSSDLVELNFTYVDDADAADTIAVLDIVAVTAATGDADTLYGINIANITGQANLIETAIAIGTGWTSAITVASGEVLISAGNMQFNDDQVLTFGTDDDVAIDWTNAGQDFLVDNTSVTGSTIFQLGTDTTATDFQVQNDTGNLLFGVDGAGGITLAGSTTVDMATAGDTTLTITNTTAANNAGVEVDTESATSDEAVINIETDVVDADHALAATAYAADTSKFSVDTDGDTSIGGKVVLGRQSVTLADDTSGVKTVTPTASYIEVTSSAVTGDVDSDNEFILAAGTEGQVVILVAIDEADTNSPKLNEGATGKYTAATQTLTDDDSLMVIYTGGNWVQVSALQANTN